MKCRDVTVRSHIKTCLVIASCAIDLCVKYAWTSASGSYYVVASYVAYLSFTRLLKLASVCHPQEEEVISFIG